MRSLLLLSLLLASPLAVVIACASDESISKSPPVGEAMASDDVASPMPHDLKDLMRAKVAWASVLLEAVAMENHPLVARNADALYELSLESAFIVQDTVTYRAYGDEFRNSVKELAANARANDQAAIERSYEKVTHACFNCHRYVRSERFGASMPGRVSMR